MIRVLVWAKSAITRAGLEALVHADARFEVCDAESHRADPIRTVRSLAPDVVLLEAPEVATLSPFLAAAGHSGAQLVVLTDDLNRSQIRQMLQNGVRALLLRDAEPREITAALEAAAQGLAVVSADLLNLLLPTGSELGDAGDLPHGEALTARELEVLARLAEGAGNKEIASRMRISEHTVKFHVSAILGKLGAATRTEAVSRGYRQGLIAM